jgi:tetratricopeptide (TPR) repeat protein
MRIEWIETCMSDAERLIYSNEVTKGLDVLNDLLYEEPGYGSLHNHIGWAYLYYTSETAKAELHFKMAMLFEKEFAAPYLHMGNLYVRMGRYEEAIAFFEKGLTLPGANRIAFLESAGQAYELRSEYGKAISFYKKAMLTSIAEHEITNLRAGIKRCQRKRLAFYFTI